MVPCVIFEDEHLLVVNKPAGWNTHAPAPHVGEGIYDWLKHREPRWRQLAILHRLDKETSGVLVFGKTPLANRSLTRQFTERDVHKHYQFLTDQPVPRPTWRMATELGRVGPRYASLSPGQGGSRAETEFTVIARSDDKSLIAAEPRTGRTHQIRVHAAESGVPVLGDTLYGGRAFSRLCLHAEALSFEHPESGERQNFAVRPEFDAEARQALRAAFIDPQETNAYRLINGAADGWGSWHVDRFGDFLLSHAEGELDRQRRMELERLLGQFNLRGAYHRRLERQARRIVPAEASPRLVLGEAAPERFTMRENGLVYELSFDEGYSVGLFLDQRDNRRCLMTGHVAAGFSPLTARAGASPVEVLNVFAYTCGFSVGAAAGGARVTSLDLSRKYLDWGRRNFELNGIDPSKHDFIYGDAFDWMKRLYKKGRLFDAVLLDPPTFSQSKQSGVFRAEKDYGKLVRAAVSLLRPSGVLLASTNAARWESASFLDSVREAIRSQGRRVASEHYRPQPPDFPISREEPAYLKTAWFAVEPGREDSVEDKRRGRKTQRCREDRWKRT